MKFTTEYLIAGQWVPGKPPVEDHENMEKAIHATKLKVRHLPIGPDGVRIVAGKEVEDAAS